MIIVIYKRDNKNKDMEYTHRIFENQIQKLKKYFQSKYVYHDDTKTLSYLFSSLSSLNPYFLTYSRKVDSANCQKIQNEVGIKTLL